MSAVFLAIFAAGCVCALLCGRMEELGAELLGAGGAAVQLSVTMAGAYMIWCGMMKILEESGVSGRMAQLMQRPVRLLLGRDGDREDVRKAVCMNLTANLLGLGNAATPAGLEAMRLMAQGAQGKRITHGMCMFLLLNASSLQVVPTTVISMRAACGAAHPADILLPTLLSSAVATLTAAALGLACRGKGAK